MNEINSENIKNNSLKKIDESTCMVRIKKIVPKKISNQINFEEIIELLSMKKFSRSSNQNNFISNYLCNKFDYFKNIKEKNEIEKLNKILAILQLEKYNINEKIINYGDDGDKFYLLLKGKVGIYEPFPKKVELTTKEYILELLKIKNNEYLKFLRILKLNNNEIDEIFFQDERNFTNFSYIQTKKKRFFYLEDIKKINDFSDGFTFGETSLINNEHRKNTIIAESLCYLVSIDKLDYQKIIKDLEDMELKRSTDIFKNNYQFFYYFSKYRILKILNNMKNYTISKKEYLFKQFNLPFDGVYFIEEGSFEMTVNLNFEFFNDYIEFINEDNYSLLKNIQTLKEEELKKYINDSIETNYNNLNLIFKKNQNKQLFTEKNINPYNIENSKILQQEDFDKKNYELTVIVKKINAPDFIGFEECFDLKPRFSSIKCLSSENKVKKINLYDFIDIIAKDTKNLNYYEKNIIQKKMNLIQQIQKTAEFKLKNIDNILKEKYLNLVKIEYPKKFNFHTKNEKHLIKNFSNPNFLNKLNYFYSPKKNKNKFKISKDYKFNYYRNEISNISNYDEIKNNNSTINSYNTKNNNINNNKIKILNNIKNINFSNQKLNKNNSNKKQKNKSILEFSKKESNTIQTNLPNIFVNNDKSRFLTRSYLSTNNLYFLNQIKSINLPKVTINEKI